MAPVQLERYRNVATFPTIPTSGAAKILGTNQENTTATRTFPDLSSLTKSPGDLLLAIIIAYQASSTGATFSGWSGGFTEFLDVGNSATPTMAIGAAYKLNSTGQETGTFTVTQAATVTGFAAMILMAITNAHLTTVPEATAIAVGTTAAADPASLSPSWGSADTLWVNVAGNGETSGTGAWGGIGSAGPSNYGNFFHTNPTDSSTIGQSDGGVSFRQNTATSEDAGTITGTDLSNARNAALTIAVRPRIVSLANPHKLRNYSMLRR